VERPGHEFRNYAMRNVTGEANLMHWLARVAEFDRLALGMICEFPTAPHLLALRLSPLATVFRGGLDRRSGIGATICTRQL
jgi:hypothetical protein